VKPVPLATTAKTTPKTDVGKQSAPAARVELAQRPTRPSQPPPPAPPPPQVQPRDGVIEPPRVTPPKPPEPQVTEPPKPPPAPAAPAVEPLQITFAANSAILNSEARAALDVLAATLKTNAAVRALLKAYTSTGSSVSETRRLSLKRGMAVRLYLIDKGVRSTRIDLQALGKSPDNGPTDRVDVLPGKP
jgi:outer membrane protein OmpA-like peptidoglycan-associated protein